VVAGQRACLYRVIDQHGQGVDVLLSMRRDLAAARRFFIRAMQAGAIPVEITTDRAHVYSRVSSELIPSPCIPSGSTRRTRSKQITDG
jgi:transposase, IS6 family